jgi:hypothetical protein
MRRSTHIFLLILLITFTSQLHSQISITNYSLFTLGVNTSQEKRVSGELKVFSTLYASELQTEFGMFLNFKARDYHRFSVGLGVGLYPFAGFDNIYALTLPMQLEVFPLQQFKRLSLVYELSSMLVVESDIGFRNLFGIRYTFGKRQKKEKSE